MPTVHTYRDLDALAAAAADDVAQLIAATPARGSFSLALAGGRTPRPLYERLARDHADLPWDRVHVFFGDERFVPATDAESNYRMAREALLTKVPIPEINVYPMPTDLDDVADAARVYGSTLRGFFGKEAPVFDLMLLGLGDDGHTASLFPGSRALKITSRWVATAKAPATAPVRDRITLTLPAINAARRVFFLVSGSSKREALTAILSKGGAVAERYPAASVAGPDVHWFVDEAAHGQDG